MKDTTYHSLLRISALTLALLLLFDSGLLSPVTKQISQDTQLYIASAVGMQANVQPTELNQLTADLTQRERALSQKERAIAVTLEEQKAPSGEYSTYIMSAVLFIILVLILLNYALDYMRIRAQVPRNTHEKVA